MTTQPQPVAQPGAAFFPEQYQPVPAGRHAAPLPSPMGVTVPGVPTSAQLAGEDFLLVVPAKPRARRRIKFGGVVYENFRAPKALASMAIAKAGKEAKEDPMGLVDAIKGWLFDAFGTVDGGAVLARLMDGEDDLDLNAVTDLIQKTTELSVENPTG